MIAVLYDWILLAGIFVMIVAVALFFEFFLFERMDNYNSGLIGKDRKEKERR